MAFLSLTEWQAFSQIRGAERVMLLQALFALPLIRIGLRLFGLAWVQKLLDTGHSRPGNDAALPQAAARMVAAAAHIVHANCLQRSLMLWWLLHRRDVASDLRIGVRRQGDQLTAHAWIEYAGVVINDRADVARLYAPFAESIGRTPIAFEETTAPETTRPQ
jgi:hypothetical protein